MHFLNFFDQEGWSVLDNFTEPVAELAPAVSSRSAKVMVDQLACGHQRLWEISITSDGHSNSICDDVALGGDHIPDSYLGLDLLHVDHSVFSNLLANAKKDLIDDNLICSLKLKLAINEN